MTSDAIEWDATERNGKGRDIRRGDEARRGAGRGGAGHDAKKATRWDETR